MAFRRARPNEEHGRLYKLWLREQLQRKLGPGVHSISLTGTRTREEQEILGMSQILLVMFPFAIELALKSLWDCFHENGTYERRHDLHVLFESVDRDGNGRTCRKTGAKAGAGPLAEVPDREQNPP